VRRGDAWLLLILAAAFLTRVFLAVTLPYVHDEENTHIPLSTTISLAPGAVNLPIRGENHGALPAYVVKASSMLFGTTPIAFRALHVLLGLVVIVLVYRLAGDWYGPTAARWAAALMAFNDYFLSVSARATAHVPHLFLVTGALYAFSRFLASQRAGWLYLAGLSAGLAFYCKEHSALVVPVFFATLLLPRSRHWLRGPHAYLACALFALVIAPDVVWNARADPETARVAYTGQEVGQATYRAHLQRVGGFGVSPYPAMFYGKDAVIALHGLVTGRALIDNTPEYTSVNPLLGLVLVASVLVAAFRRSERNAVQPLLLFMALGIFGFFTLIAPGDPPYRLDPVSWVWVETTLVPAVVLAGARLAGAAGRWRTAAWALAALGILYAVDGAFYGSIASG
jgi:4-amino-4-deoxy-L-arabinose transferase-like glycosyltransferase